MPKTNTIIYQEKNGSVPLLDWLDSLSFKVKIKCIERIERLKEEGYNLRRPICDFLDKGIYELRAKYLGVHYRILYSFVGENVVLLSHGCSKTDKVPRKEITKAVKNGKNYMTDPEAHTYKGEL